MKKNKLRMSIRIMLVLSFAICSPVWAAGAMTIESAVYCPKVTSGGSSCNDVTTKITERCGGKSWCNLIANNDQMGVDPRIGTRKEIKVKCLCSSGGGLKGRCLGDNYDFYPEGSPITLWCN